MSRFSGKGPSQRQLRVGEEIRHALAEPLLRGDLHNEVLAGHSITVTEVTVSPDLKNATAYVMPLGGADQEAVLAALGEAAPYLRSLVGRAVRLKFTPRLTFRIDTSFDEGDKIDRLLASEAVQRDVEAAKAREAERADAPQNGDEGGNESSRGDGDGPA
jgi:ribosome-binding factor A